MFNCNKKNRNIIIILLLPLSLFLGYEFGRVDLYKMEFSNNFFQYYLLTIVNLVLWIEMAKKLEKISFLKFFGKNTILIVGTHYYILFVLRSVYKILRLSESVKEKIGIFFIEGILTVIISYLLILLKEEWLVKKNKVERIGIKVCEKWY